MWHTFCLSDSTSCMKLSPFQCQIWGLYQINFNVASTVPARPAFNAPLYLYYLKHATLPPPLPWLHIYRCHTFLLVCFLVFTLQPTAQFLALEGFKFSSQGHCVLVIFNKTHLFPTHSAALFNFFSLLGLNWPEFPLLFWFCPHAPTELLAPQWCLCAFWNEMIWRWCFNQTMVT